MPYKNIEDRRAAGRRSAKKCREANPAKEAEKAHKYYSANKEHLNGLRIKRRAENPEQYERDKKNSSAALKIQKRKLKARLVEFFGGKCITCGIEDDPCIYDFHHRDPTEKDFEIARLVARTRDWGTVLKEAQKCDLLCSNCHRKIHKA